MERYSWYKCSYRVLQRTLRCDKRRGRRNSCSGGRDPASFVGFRPFSTGDLSSLAEIFGLRDEGVLQSRGLGFRCFNRGSYFLVLFGRPRRCFQSLLQRGEPFEFLLFFQWIIGLWLGLYIKIYFLDFVIFVEHAGFWFWFWWILFEINLLIGPFLCY